MARITILTPTGAGTRTGNLHTAQRYARFLRSSGHRVSVALTWEGQPCDLLIALHARRSANSIQKFKNEQNDKPLLVVLTGTDLYRDLPASKEAQRSLDFADRIVVLQEDAKRKLAQKWRRKTTVVYQSSSASLRHRPPRDRFRVAVVGHLRAEKDPFRAVLAFSHLRDESLELVHLGAPLDPALGKDANQWMKRDARYRWLGSVPHSEALGWIARSHLLVVSSVMEGGANVICEAARIGTPVIGSRMSGNVGMLGRRYPGLYRLFDEKGLAALIKKALEDRNYYKHLKDALARRRRLFAPAAERASINRVARRLLGKMAP
ncbi:MAG TPA: selenoneine biosynthesis selenosugar synthase SenB [Burkholderiales bacterium]|jgi:putative glycosyltransferase (TIGR04348 family)|nr:selenoneine biosynthesis selenosugar synthase SenB [Burkholderiales bacterium]